jgi:chitinase
MIKKGAYSFIPSYTSTSINSPPSTTPASELTHLFIAFFRFNTDGTINTSHQNYIDYITYKSEIFDLKTINPNLKIICSVGGGTATSEISTIISTSNGRQTFADSIKAFYDSEGFDGVDIDYEGFTSSNYNHYKQFIQTLKTHDIGELSIVAGAEELIYMDNNIFNDVDYIMLFGYDFNGSFSTVSDHNQNLYTPTNSVTIRSVDNIVNTILTHGVDPSKVILGIGYYARRFNDTDGYLQSYSTVTSDIIYKNIPESEQCSAIIDMSSKAAWNYDPITRIFYSFDTHQIIQYKINYIKKLGLGGIFSWYIGLDYPLTSKYCYSKYINDNL